MNRSDEKTDAAPLVRHQVGNSPSTVAIVRAVAAVENEEPQSLAPLGDVVDPDALETLCNGPDTVVHVTFSYAGHRIVVTGDTVEVYE
jgi:hypothetical protein